MEINKDMYRRILPRKENKTKNNIYHRRIYNGKIKIVILYQGNKKTYEE